MLRQHPQVFMSPLKEPHYFASDRAPRFERPEGRPLPRTFEDYTALFTDARPEQKVGEASASYLWSRVAPGEIARVRPDARIIAILREPVAFLRSMHLNWVRNGWETERDLAKAIELEPARARGEQLPPECQYPVLLQYTDHVRYIEQLRRYAELFAPEQMLVLIHEDYRADNEAVLRDVMRLVGVDEHEPLDTLRANVSTGEVRSERLDGVVSSVTVGRGALSRSARAAVKSVTTRRMRRSAFEAVRRRAVLSDPPEPDEEFLRELRARFLPEVQAVGEHLGRDLVSLWGYDEAR
jgi:Sulfotransferase domain